MQSFVLSYFGNSYYVYINSLGLDFESSTNGNNAGLTIISTNT